MSIKGAMMSRLRERVLSLWAYCSAHLQFPNGHQGIYQRRKYIAQTPIDCKMPGVL